MTNNVLFKFQIRFKVIFINITRNVTKKQGNKSNEQGNDQLPPKGEMKNFIKLKIKPPSICFERNQKSKKKTNQPHFLNTKLNYLTQKISNRNAICRCWRSKKKQSVSFADFQQFTRKFDNETF